MLEDLERYDEALACYDALLRAQPENMAGLSNRAGLLAQQGRLEEARATLDRALALYPEHPVLVANRQQLNAQE